MTTRAVIIDYGSGNIRSVHKALQAAARADTEVIVSSTLSDIQNATHLILPGVGAFGDCVSGLARIPNMLDTLTEQVMMKGKPFLGICVGMQMLAAKGFEHGEHRGLGWLPAEVVKIEPNHRLMQDPLMAGMPKLRIPHMGWNELRIRQHHPVLSSLPSDAHAYFVHSYHMRPADPDLTELPDWCLTTTHYGHPIYAIVGENNMIGTQFHPEKSQETGLKLLSSFLSWRP